MTSRSLLLATGAGVCLAMASTAALAQSNTIEELVVTAEKREQSLQDVPVAVTAFTDKRREEIGINSIQDMTNFTPGLQYNAATDRISLRGVGRLTNVLSGDASVANYNDGIYETFAVAAGRSTLFLDRVEVLRGPQGTLYGRNAIGGALNQISKRPTEDWYGEVRASYANYERRVFEGAVSGPTLLPNVQFRLAGSWIRQTQGWVDNVIPGYPDEGGVQNEVTIEGQLQGKFFDDKLDAWVKVMGGRWHNGAGGPGSQSQGWTRAPYPTYEYAASGIQLNAGYGCSGAVTNVVNLSPLGCVNPQQNNPWKMANAQPIDVRLPIYNSVAGHLTWHADDFDIRYITGGTTYHYELRVPNSTAGGTLGGSSLTPITAYTLASGARIFPQEFADYREYNKFWSHEVNLVSTHEGPFQWVAGAYHYAQKYRQPVFTEVSGQKEWNGPFLAQDVFCAATGGVCAPSTMMRRYDNRPQSEASSYAAYGQIDWEFASNWKTTFGLRYSHDKKHGREQVRLLCWGTPTCYGVPGEAFGPNIPLTDITAFAVSRPPADNLPKGVTSPTTFDPATGFASRTYSATWEAVSGTAGLEWSPDDDTMAYAKYSRGYKSGGFYVGIFTFIAPEPYADKESVDSFEIGLKKTFGGNLQLNGAAFYYGYKDLQIPIAGVSGSGAAAQVATNFYNVPKATSKGVEFELTWQPIEDLQILLSYAYLDAEVRRGSAIDIADPTALAPGARPIGPAVPCTTEATCDVFTGLLQRAQDLKGAALPNSGKNKLAVNVNYVWRLPVGDLTASASYIYRDVQYGTLFERGHYKSPEWDQVDARLTWDRPDRKVRVIAYVKNLFDTIGYDSGALASRFAGFSTDPVTQTARQVNQGVYSTYYITPPRTYGVEVQYRFF